MERDDTGVAIAYARLNFNSHAHVERDIIYFSSLSVLFDFNSHAHVERDVRIGDSGTASENFNSHAHVERDNSTTITTPAI